MVVGEHNQRPIVDLPRVSHAGPTGVANIFDIVTHVRIQVDGREGVGMQAGLVHIVGLGSALAIHILTA